MIAPDVQAQNSKARKHHWIFIYSNVSFIHDRLIMQRVRWPILALLCLLLRASAMDVSDVMQVLRDAATRARAISPDSIIAVVDREGFVLAVQSTGIVPSDPQRSLAIAVAVSKAGTAAFLSSQGHAFSSRTAGYIVQQHFPPEVHFTPPGPLVGVNFSNLSFSDVNRFKDPAAYVPGFNGGTNGAPIPFSSLAGAPGGLPLYKDGILLGGVGVTIDGSEILRGIQGLNQVYDVNEDIALAGQWHYPPSSTILGSGVFIDGIRVEYNESTSRRAKYLPGYMGQPVAPFTIRASPPVAYPQVELGGVLGEVRQPILGDPSTAPLGAARLSASEVTNILALAAARARITRAGIRLPPGKAAQVFITVVNNPNVSGSAPVVLGTFRTPDATIFSWDVAVQKARTVLFFSTDYRAFSTRTVGFLSQSLFPPGIDGTFPGPFFGLQERFSLFPLGTNTLNGAVVPMTGLTLKRELPNGMTIFAGGFPLYRNGVLIGAIGVSGDGIDQDDLIAASGTVNFLAPDSIRADHMMFRGARLPYAKFPRNPSL
jgi:uncharacterized protein GlcG (DUF336 family)